MSQTSQDFATPETAAGFARAFAEDEVLGRLSFAARRILAVSAALFYRDGAAATSVRDITRACGLSPGALYNHFASKDDVLDVLVQHGHDRLEQRVAAAVLDAGAGPVEQLAAFVRAHVLAHVERPEMAQVVRREYRHLSAARYQRTVARRRLLRRQLSTVLDDGQRAGVFDLIDDDPSASTGVAVMVLDMCSRTSEWYQPRSSTPPDVLAQRYVDAALRLAGATTAR